MRALFRLRSFIVLGIVAALVGGIYWIVSHHAETGPQGPRRGGMAASVGVAEVKTGDLPIALTALGTVTPLAAVTVKTQIAGQLQQVAFTEGQMVRKGDFLAQIDPRPYLAQLGQYQGQLQHDQALLKAAQTDLHRYQTLADQDSIARQQLDTQSALVQQYQGTVATDQALVANAKLNVDYCHITAPATGRLGLRQVDQGNYVQASDGTGLVVITQLQPITVIFTLPEDALPGLMKRVHSGAALAVTAFDRSGMNKLADGKVLTVDNQIDATTGTVKVKAVFDNADETLFPNQFVNMQLQLDTLKNAVFVPNAAVLRGAPGTFVYVLQDDNKVAVRPIKTGPADALHTAVTEGLAVGDKVVTDGTDKLRDGATVVIAGIGAGAGAKAGGDAPAAPPHGEHKHRDSHE